MMMMSVYLTKNCVNFFFSGAILLFCGGGGFRICFEVLHNVFGFADFFFFSQREGRIVPSFYLRMGAVGFMSAVSDLFIFF